ncbi:Hypothetical protein R9X50_00332500 [Acrodontium crateriforme]|uniref:Zn(2)-C6 fungal-type domain-containing protein n=1 Tax=Acrodontium crateriforme TaxID=150365 RepID=A0AAQ3R9C4_9PEZI|nr:Hypothetical protein R9X50_00332500 [Acrodontium crateriforme]
MPKQRTTCTRCSRRHQSCDRSVPCLRCVQAGEAESCKTEWEGGYDAKVCRTYLPTGRLNGAVKNVRHHIPVGNPTNHHEPISPESQASSTTGHGRHLNDITTRIEDASLRDKTIETHLDDRYLNMGPSQPVAVDSDSVELNAVMTVDEMQAFLPSPTRIYELVHYHEHYLTWYHGTICVPVFNDELAKNMAKGHIWLHDTDLLWSALLFSVMAQSLTCASDNAMATWGYDRKQKMMLGRRWFDCTVSCLNRGKWTSRPKLSSIQAVESLAMSAHPLGFANDQFILYGNAMRIALALGLQRVPHDPEQDDIDERKEPPNSPKRVNVREREVKRRVWMLLGTQDWFSATYTGMYWLQPEQSSTTLPRHFDDETMSIAPEDRPIISDFSKHIQHMGWIAAKFADAVRVEKDLEGKYHQIQIYDAELRKMDLHNLPRSFQRSDIPWVRWTRGIITILLANKLLLMHRTFLSKSFNDIRYVSTRWASIEASKTIISEYNLAMLDTQRPTLWNDDAHLVTAAITLSIDIFHRSPHEPEFHEHRKLVEVAVASLRRSADRSVIADRGYRVLRTLWDQLSKYHYKKAQTQKSPKMKPPPLQPPVRVNTPGNWRSGDSYKPSVDKWCPPSVMPGSHSGPVTTHPPHSGVLLQPSTLPVIPAVQLPPDQRIGFQDVPIVDGWLDTGPLMDLSWIHYFQGQFPMKDVEGESFVNELFLSAQPR